MSGRLRAAFGRRKPMVGILLVLVAFSLGYCQSADENVARHGSLDYPPLSGGRDQVDYHIMAFTLMSTGFPGKVYNDEMRQPFVRFAKTHSGELAPEDEWQLGFFQRAPKEPGLATNHYRPWLYPLILGASYKLFGYEFSVGRRVNIVLYGLCIAIIIGLLFFFVSPMNALFGLSAFFLVEGFTRRTTAFLAEPSQGLALCLLLAMLVLFANRPKSFWSAVGVGLSLGLCMLGKQMFAPIAILVIGAIAVSWLVSRAGSTLGGAIAIVLGAGLIAGPWVTYNVVGTKDPTLLLGTSGWQDMPAAYDVRTVDSSSINDVREIIFSDYEEKHGVRIRGQVDRARYGRKIFLENLRSGAYDDIFWQRVRFKLGDELRARPLEWIVRGIALLGFLFLSARVGGPLASVLFGSLLFFALMRSTGGRTFDTFWPLIAFLAALPAGALIDLIMERWRPAFVAESRWSAAKNWLTKPASPRGDVTRQPHLTRRIVKLLRRWRRS